MLTKSPNLSLYMLINVLLIKKTCNLLSKHQSGVRPGDSCIYQLLAIIYDTFPSFDCNPTLETCSVLLDFGIKLLTRLCLGLSHLREHKFNHNFQDTINPLCSCSLESESTTHFFLRCQNFMDLCKCLMNELIKIDSCVLTLDEKSFMKLLLYGDDRYDSKTNKSIILASINFMYSSEHFDGQLM